MKKVFFLLALATSSLMAAAQSQTTVALENRFEESLTLFFYKNTLRMLNQEESPEFDEMVRNIEKMKFLMVSKSENSFGSRDYRALVTEYQKELFEPIVTSRVEGMNFDVYIRDAKGSKPGTVVLVNDSSRLFVLDIVGTIDVTKAGALYKALSDNTDVGKRIRNMADPKSDSIRSKYRKRDRFR